jgi:hypothetical protein
MAAATRATATASCAARADLLAPDALRAEIRVLRAEVRGPLQRGVRQPAQWMRGELRVDHVRRATRAIAHGTPIYPVHSWVRLAAAATAPMYARQD